MGILCVESSTLSRPVVRVIGVRLLQQKQCNKHSDRWEYLNQLTDEQLVASLRGGEQDSLTVLFDRYGLFLTWQNTVALLDRRKAWVFDHRLELWRAGSKRYVYECTPSILRIVGHTPDYCTSAGGSAPAGICL